MGKKCGNSSDLSNYNNCHQFEVKSYFVLFNLRIGESRGCVCSQKILLPGECHNSQKIYDTMLKSDSQFPEKSVTCVPGFFLKILPYRM